MTAKHGGERPLGYLDFYELALAKGDYDEAGRVLDTFFASSRLPQTAAGAVDPQAILGDIEWARDQAMRSDPGGATRPDGRGQDAAAWRGGAAGSRTEAVAGRRTGRTARERDHD